MPGTAMLRGRSGGVTAALSIKPKGAPKLLQLRRTTCSAGIRLVGAAAQRHVAAAEAHHDVAIIGGGPAGLLAAKALLAVMPEADIKVFEAAASYRRNLGAGVLVDINGWRALHAVDGALAERMCSQGIRLQSGHYLSEAGGPLMAAPVPPFNHEGNIRVHGHTQTMIHWADIRWVLFEGLPPGVVSFSSRLASLTPGVPGAEPAVLELQVPEEEGQQLGQRQEGNIVSAGAGTSGAPAPGGRVRRVTADLVIAADGYYSLSKRLAFGASGPPLLPTFRDKVIWRALVAYEDPDNMPALLRDLGSKSEAVTWLSEGKPPARSALAYPVNDNRFVWTCIAPVEDIEAAGLPPWSPKRGAEQDLGIQLTGSAGNSPKERCMAVFRNHPPELLDLISRTDPGAITEHGYYTHDLEAMLGAPDWVRGNVLALGDAAHTGAPDGMGLNMAWEDAAVLAAEIKRRGGRPTSEALEAYCAARLPRVHEIWREWALIRPRRDAARLAAAFEPLGPGSSGHERTGPPSAQGQQSSGAQGRAKELVAK